ncbi:MAG: hypothetical protein ACK5XN_27290, partial [Bacteroidota bacterium]
LNKGETLTIYDPENEEITFNEQMKKQKIKSRLKELLVDYRAKKLHYLRTKVMIDFAFDKIDNEQELNKCIDLFNKNYFYFQKASSKKTIEILYDRLLNGSFEGYNIKFIDFFDKKIYFLNKIMESSLTEEEKKEIFEEFLKKESHLTSTMIDYLLLTLKNNNDISNEKKIEKLIKDMGFFNERSNVFEKASRKKKLEIIIEKYHKKSNIINDLLYIPNKIFDKVIADLDVLDINNIKIFEETLDKTKENTKDFLKTKTNNEEIIEILIDFLKDFLKDFLNKKHNYERENFFNYVFDIPKEIFYDVIKSLEENLKNKENINKKLIEELINNLNEKIVEKALDYLSKKAQKQETKKKLKEILDSMKAKGVDLEFINFLFLIPDEIFDELELKLYILKEYIKDYISERISEELNENFKEIYPELNKETIGLLLNNKDVLPESIKYLYEIRQENSLELDINDLENLDPKSLTVQNLKQKIEELQKKRKLEEERKRKLLEEDKKRKLEEERQRKLEELKKKILIGLFSGFCLLLIYLLNETNGSSQGDNFKEETSGSSQGDNFKTETNGSSQGDNSKEETNGSSQENNSKEET